MKFKFKVRYLHYKKNKFYLPKNLCNLNETCTSVKFKYNLDFIEKKIEKVDNSLKFYFHEI